MAAVREKSFPRAPKPVMKYTSQYDYKDSTELVLS